MKLQGLQWGHPTGCVTCVQCTTYTTKNDNYIVTYLSELGPPELTLVTWEADLKMGVIQDISMLHNIISQWQEL